MMDVPIPDVRRVLRESGDRSYGLEVSEYRDSKRNLKKSQEGKLT